MTRAAPLPADDSLLATPAMLDRPAAALLARRIVDAGPRHPAATIRSLCAAGLTDMVREMVATMTPDPDDLIAVLEVLHEKGSTTRPATWPVRDGPGRNGPGRRRP